jgi:hypothetical protein
LRHEQERLRENMNYATENMGLDQKSSRNRRRAAADPLLWMKSVQGAPEGTLGSRRSGARWPAFMSTPAAFQMRDGRTFHCSSA